MGTTAQQIIRFKKAEIKFHHYFNGYPSSLGEETLNICVRFNDWEELKKTFDNIVIQTIETNAEGDPSKDDLKLLRSDFKKFLEKHQNLRFHYNPPCSWKQHLDYKYIIDLDEQTVEFHKGLGYGKNYTSRLFLKVHLSDVKFYYDYDSLEVTE